MLVPRETQEVLKHVSIKGRMAMAVRCLERVLERQRLSPSERDALLEEFWAFVEKEDLGAWDRHRRGNEALMAVGDFIEQGWELPAGSGLRDLPRFVLEMIYKTDELGMGDLYGAVKSYSLETHAALLRVLDLALEHGFDIPPVEPFLKSPFTQERGWGASVPRTFFDA
jgi:hypothetical protein